MTFYMWPAVIALIIKVRLLMSAINQGWGGKTWIGFVAVFALHNISELLLLSAAHWELSSEFLLRYYHCCTIAALVYCLAYVSNTSQYRWQRIALHTAAWIGMVIGIVLIFTDSMINGFTKISYSVIATKGLYYPIFQIFMLVGSVLIFGTLLHNYRKTGDPKEEVQIGYTLLALTPLVLVTVGVVGLMMAGYKVNSLMIIPVASTLFLIITVKGRNSYLVNNDPRRLIPLTLESDFDRQLNLAKSQYSLENLGHKEAMFLIERALINYKREKNHRKHKQTAESMKVNRSTLYDRLHRLHIQRKREDQTNDK